MQLAFDLHSALPRLFPKAVAWAEQQSRSVTRSGAALDPELVSIARRVGVEHPEHVRIAEVSQLPLPEDPELRAAALATNLLGPNMIGMTFGHGIYICRGCRSIRLMSHELRHVHQYEQAGSIASFLAIYLEQIATVGYDAAPLELDARAHEITA